jgi:hypothetical protein
MYLHSSTLKALQTAMAEHAATLSALRHMILPLYPRVDAALQPWAEISQRLRRN